MIVRWDVLETFWPYWDLVGVDWNAGLDTAHRDPLDDHSVVSIDGRPATEQLVASEALVSAAHPRVDIRSLCSAITISRVILIIVFRI